MKFHSLSFRLVFSASLMLAAFFALVTLVLEQGFKESAELALQEKLQVQVYALLTAVEISRHGKLAVPENLHEPRFASPGSGLYAFIRNSQDSLLWRSPSAIGVDRSPMPNLTPGDSVFTYDIKTGQFVFHFNVVWEDESGEEDGYIFSVAEDGHSVIQQVSSFRESLTRWLIASGLVLIIAQFFVLRWSLKPLREIVHDLEAIERGDQSRLEGRYPTELRGLAGNLNALVSSERAQLERYRNTLADLAHSLKTPLAILRGCITSGNLASEVNTVLETQISRMNEIVEYQLQRAAAKGEKKITGKVEVVAIIKKIIVTLEKVHKEKQIVFDVDLPKQCSIYCEAGDLYEIAGNLLDNACKWCRKQVKVVIQVGAQPGSMYLSIEDDGPGIPIDKLDSILLRGVRADENIQGHGIGMAVVNDLIGLLDGSLSGMKSEILGGMKWEVVLR